MIPDRSFQDNKLLIRLFKLTVEFVKKLLQGMRDYQVAPVISGAAALILLKEVIFSKDLGQTIMQWAIISLLILFVSSALLYYLLSRLEKSKDEYLLGVIGRTVGDIFKKYGQQMAVSNADHAKAKDMNEIMQTIVNLVKEMKYLGNKKYRN